MTYAETIQSERLYTKIARTYPKVFERAILAEGRLTGVVQRHMNGRTVLDLACGNGRWLDRFHPCAYTGVDLNAAMLEEARRLFPAHTFLQADMTRLPFADASFEGAVSLFGAMGHLPPEGQERMCGEIRRVLRDGGAAILTNGNMWSPFNLTTTIKGNRIRVEGTYLKVHPSTPPLLKKCVTSAGLELLELSSYDYLYVPLAPLQLTACLLGKEYDNLYARLMDILEHCRHVWKLKWFGKQLVAVCRKTCD